MESLVALPRVESMNKLNELRSIYVQIETTIRNLRSLKVETKTYGSLLIPLLVEKLPNELTVIISRKFENNVWNLDDLLFYFKQELQAKERCPSSSKVKKDSERDDYFTARQVYTCSIINETIGVFFVRIFTLLRSTEVKLRVSILRKKARCFVCLQSGHVSKNCKSDYRCNKCMGRHHISICGKPPPS